MVNMNSARVLAQRRYLEFERLASDLYPNVYTKAYCLELAEKEMEIRSLAYRKGSWMLVHYYQAPEIQEIGHYMGDSLALSRFAVDNKVSRIEYLAVAFMAVTAKVITDNQSRIFIGGSSQTLGCSLVSGTDHAWIRAWKQTNPDGIIISYINSDLYTKSLSDYISTSRNTDKIIAHAIEHHAPGTKILVLPDKYLGHVMKLRAIKILQDTGVVIDTQQLEEVKNQIEVYDKPFGGFNACCYVHEQLGPDRLHVLRAEHPRAELLIHPECGCTASCYHEIATGDIPYQSAYILSTEGMIKRASESKAKEFIVATEAGHVYALRKHVPNKIFIPLASNAHCRFMKANTYNTLLDSLRNNRKELIICDCPCGSDPTRPYEDEEVLHLPRFLVEKARIAIQRMYTIT